MASKSLESRSEIEGAKRLLTVAQKWRTSADEMLKVITQSSAQVCGASKQIEFAREQLSLSEKEVHEAQAYLKQIEARWEVIDVDDEPISSSSAGSRVQNNTNTSHAPSLSNPLSNPVILSDDSNDAEDITNNAAVSTASRSSLVAAATISPTFNIGNKVMLQNTTPLYNGRIGIIKGFSQSLNDTLYTIELLDNKQLVNAHLFNMKLVGGSVVNESVITAASASTSTVSSVVIGSKVILNMPNTSLNGQQGVVKSKTSSHHGGGMVYRGVKKLMSF